VGQVLTRSQHTSDRKDMSDGFLSKTKIAVNDPNSKIYNIKQRFSTDLLSQKDTKPKIYWQMKSDHGKELKTQFLWHTALGLVDDRKSALTFALTRHTQI